MSADGKLLAKQTGTQNVTHDGAVATKPSYSGKIVDENGNVLDVDNTKATIKHTIGWSEHKETPNSHYLYSGDDYLDNITEKKTVKGPLDNEYEIGGDINVKSQHFAGVDIQQANTGQRHQVRTGETLKSISMLYYGSEDFWYIIADSNGMANAPDEALTSGQTLNIPQLVNNNNSAYDLQPMNLAEALGDTTPALPYVPPPAEAGCNAVATLVVVAVAVAVTGGVAGATVFNGSAILGGAVGAAAGSVASQVVGIGLGVQEKFSWSQVAVSAVTGGVAGGISDKIASANGLSGGANATSSTNNLWVSDGALSGFSRGVASAGASIAGAATAKVLNGHSGFSWANIASSAVVAGIGGRLPGEGGANGQNFGADVLAQVGRSAVGYGVNRAFGGDQSWNNRDIAVDAFGNAIGNSIVQGISKQNKPTEKELAIEAGRKGLSEDQLNTLSKRADARGTSLDELLAARGSEQLYDATDSRFNSDAVFDVGGSHILLAEQKYTVEERSLSLVDKFGSMLPSIPEASEDTFAGYMWNRTLDGTVRDRLFEMAYSFNNWKGAVVGVTVGGNVGFDWLTTAGASTTYAIDTNGDFIHVVTPEVGFQATKTKGGFLRGVLGVNHTVEDLKGMGDSVTIDVGKFSGSATLPRTVESYSYPGVPGSQLPTHSHTSLPIIEFGYSTGKEFNIAITEGYGFTLDEGKL